MPAFLEFDFILSNIWLAPVVAIIFAVLFGNSPAAVLGAFLTFLGALVLISVAGLKVVLIIGGGLAGLLIIGAIINALGPGASSSSSGFSGSASTTDWRSPVRPSDPFRSFEPPSLPPPIDPQPRPSTGRFRGRPIPFNRRRRRN